MNIEHDYLQLLNDILINGTHKQTRNGETVSVFGRQIRHKMSEGFPLLTTKKMAFKTMVVELLWFLRGDTNIKYLVDNGCNIWNGDAFRNYISKTNEYKGNWPDTMEEFIERIKTDDEFAEKWGNLGPIYGHQWRDWKYYREGLKNNDTEWDYHVECGEGESDNIGEFRSFDQIENLIHDLKTNPDSRRLMVNAWNVGELDSMVLPPCHYGFQVYTRELSYRERYDIWFTNNYETGMERNYDSRPDFDNEYYTPTPTRAISLMFNMRSNDVPLGLPFNIASYGLLLEIIGRMVNMVPDELIANLGDAHIYKNQIDGVKEQLTREPMKLPNLIISDEVNFNGTIDEFLETCNKDSFKLDGYESHPSIKMPLSN